MARRSNYRKGRKAAVAVFDQLEAERQADKDAIAAHIDSVRAEIEWIAQWEQQQVDHARACALQMRQRAQGRLEALQGHLEHLNDDGGDDEPAALPDPMRHLTDPAEVSMAMRKRLKAAE